MNSQENAVFGYCLFPCSDSKMFILVPFSDDLTQKLVHLSSELITNELESSSVEIKGCFGIDGAAHPLESLLDLGNNPLALALKNLTEQKGGALHVSLKNPELLISVSSNPDNTGTLTFSGDELFFSFRDVLGDLYSSFTISLEGYKKLLRDSYNRSLSDN